MRMLLSLSNRLMGKLKFWKFVAKQAQALEGWAAEGHCMRCAEALNSHCLPCKGQEIPQPVQGVPRFTGLEGIIS